MNDQVQATAAMIAVHLDLGVDRITQLRSTGVIPPVGCTLADARVCYIRHLRMMVQKQGRFASAKPAGDPRDRKEEAIAEKREIEVERLRGTLIDRDVALNTTARLVNTAKSNLRGLSAKAVSRIPGFNREMGVALLALVDEALRTLSAQEVPTDDEDEEEAA